MIFVFQKSREMNNDLLALQELEFAYQNVFLDYDIENSTMWVMMMEQTGGYIFSIKISEDGYDIRHYFNENGQYRQCEQYRQEQYHPEFTVDGKILLFNTNNATNAMNTVNLCAVIQTIVQSFRKNNRINEMPLNQIYVDHVVQYVIRKSPQNQTKVS